MGSITAFLPTFTAAQFADVIPFFIGTFVSMISIVDPLMAIPLFLSLTGDDTKEQKKQVAYDASLYTFGILMLFFVAGTLILNIFGISINALKIAGGLMILMSAFNMLEKKDRLLPEEQEEARTKEDVAFSPIAMPMLSGPGAIAVLIGLTADAHTLLHYLAIFLVLIIVAVLCYVCMILADTLTAKVGNTMLKAFTRIMGFILLCVGIQFIVNGVTPILEGIMHAI